MESRMKGKKTLVWAHRGASKYAPENTLPAFQKAIEMGADGIELDVQMTRFYRIRKSADTNTGRSATTGCTVRTDPQHRTKNRKNIL